MVSEKDHGQNTRRAWVSENGSSDAKHTMFIVVEKFDYCFAENGLTAYKNAKELSSESFIKFLGEEKYKKLVNFCLKEMAEMDIPVKRLSVFLIPLVETIVL